MVVKSQITQEDKGSLYTRITGVASADGFPASPVSGAQKRTRRSDVNILNLEPTQRMVLLISESVVQPAQQNRPQHI